MLLLALPGAFAAPTNTNGTSATLINAEGTVEIFRHGAKEWAAASAGTSLQVGDQLRTGPRSRATLRLSNLSVLRVGELMSYEIEPPRTHAGKPTLNLKSGSAYFFSRDKPQEVQLRTPTVSGAIRGTEFNVTVAPDGRTELTMIDGEVELANQFGTVLLTAGEQGVAETGRAPTKTAVLNAINVIQWSLYYPGVLDISELDLNGQERDQLAESLAAYQRGELLEALKQYPTNHQPASAAGHLYLGGLLLAVGLVDQSLPQLEAAASGGGNNPALANALRELIAAVKFETWKPPASPALATEFLAESYYQQSRANLTAALAAARKAAEISPRFSFAWARTAELEFSFGRVIAARGAVEESLKLAPRNAEALALKGFLLAAQHRTSEAILWFDRAIAIDGALGNAWLGRGLCRFHLGEREAGRADLQVATALEPNRSFLRSYLGKAWSENGRDLLAAKELELAKRLDPGDPTPWLYSALINRELNLINPAVEELERSVALNDNRSVYRSRFLLDEDRAVRSASLASIYRDAGMNEVSLAEAARSVTADYGNYSSHLFLANSFDGLRDPTRFNLRYETPWFNELLLANLLAPVGIPTLSPNISQQEYFRMFDRDGLGLATTTETRSDGQYRELASQYGSYRWFSYSLDLDWQHNEGVRPNNDLTRTEWYSQLKFQLTPQDSLFVLTKYQDYHSGDNFQYYDPNQPTVDNIILFSGPIAITNQTSYSKFYKYDESQNPIVVGAYHREWAPGVQTLALGGRLINNQHFQDKSVPLYYFRLNPFTKDIVFVSPNLFDVDYHSQFEIWISELNQIFQTDRNTLILGGRFQTGQFDTQNSLSNAVPGWGYPGPFPLVNTAESKSMQRWSVYGYDTYEALPSQLWLTAGLSYDRLNYPSNFRQVPISSGQSAADCLGPKAALIWSPVSKATLRLAYSRSLGGVSFDESFRLEPPQLAGFNQSYRTIIPESVVGSVSAPTLETIGAALDLKMDSQTYIELVGEALSSHVDRDLGIYRFPVSIGDASFYTSSTPQHLQYDEYSGGISVNQLLSKQWSLGVSYKYIRSELEQSLPEVPLSAFEGAREFDRADLQTVNLYLLYNHPSGFFARAEGNWYLQDRRRSIGGGQQETLPGDEFWQANFWVGYRLRRGMGDFSLGLLNATGTDYRLDPLNPYSELPRERVINARLRLRF